MKRWHTMRWARAGCAIACPHLLIYLSLHSLFAVRSSFSWVRFFGLFAFNHIHYGPSFILYGLRCMRVSLSICFSFSVFDCTRIRIIWTIMVNISNLLSFDVFNILLHINYDRSIGDNIQLASIIKRTMTRFFCVCSNVALPPPPTATTANRDKWHINSLVNAQMYRPNGEPYKEIGWWKYHFNGPLA